MEMQTKKPTWLIAIGVVGTVFTGILGLVAALIAFFSLEFLGIGVSLLASALAFGLLTKTVFRD